MYFYVFDILLIQFKSIKTSINSFLCIRHGKKSIFGLAFALGQTNYRCSCTYELV